MKKAHVYSSVHRAKRRKRTKLVAIALVAVAILGLLFPGVLKWTLRNVQQEEYSPLDYLGR